MNGLDKSSQDWSKALIKQRCTTLSTILSKTIFKTDNICSNLQQMTQSVSWWNTVICCDVLFLHDEKAGGSNLLLHHFFFYVPFTVFWWG